MLNIGRRTILLVLIPLFEGIVAVSLFFAQGGYGGGHGKLDPLIILLEIPSVLLMQWLSWPELVKQHDLILIIFLPTIANFCVACSIAFAVRLVRER